MKNRNSSQNAVLPSEIPFTVALNGMYFLFNMIPAMITIVCILLNFYIGSLILLCSLSLTKYLEKNNFTVTQAKDGVTAVDVAKNKLFNAIVVDRYTHKLDGLMIKSWKRNAQGI